MPPSVWRWNLELSAPHRISPSIEEIVFEARWRVATYANAVSEALVSRSESVCAT